MSDKPYAFVLMPFSDDFKDVYELGIKAAADLCGLRVERLDEQIFDTDMVQKIYSEIDSCDFVIADMSTRNPNVFYEVGYADAKKKLIILLTNNPDDIPFDFLHRPHILYKNISGLKQELVERLEWALFETRRRKEYPLDIQVMIKTSEIQREENSDTANVKLSIELHNKSEQPINVDCVYMYMNKEWDIFHNEALCTKTVRSEDERKSRYIINPEFTIVPPKDWVPVNILARKVIWDASNAYHLKAIGLRKDVYEHSGYVDIHVVTGSNRYEFNDLFLEITCLFDDIPF
jgi:hypothetical protein